MLRKGTLMMMPSVMRIGPEWATGDIWDKSSSPLVLRSHIGTGNRKEHFLAPDFSAALRTPQAPGTSVRDTVAGKEEGCNTHRGALHDVDVARLLRSTR